MPPNTADESGSTEISTLAGIGAVPTELEDPDGDVTSMTDCLELQAPSRRPPRAAVARILCTFQEVSAVFRLGMSTQNVSVASNLATLAKLLARPFLQRITASPGFHDPSGRCRPKCARCELSELLQGSGALGRW
jgi:hypothetical protein